MLQRKLMSATKPCKLYLCGQVLVHPNPPKVSYLRHIHLGLGEKSLFYLFGKDCNHYKAYKIIPSLVFFEEVVGAL